MISKTVAGVFTTIISNEPRKSCGDCGIECGEIYGTNHVFKNKSPICHTQNACQTNEKSTRKFKVPNGSDGSLT